MMKLPVKEHGSGVSGIYYKLNEKVGVKILEGKPFKTIAGAKRSERMEEAKSEAQNLQDAYETGIVPACFGTGIFRSPGNTVEYNVGVVMQHLGSRTLSTLKKVDKSAVVHQLLDQLEEFGINHEDLHEENIMLFRCKYYVIDFDPCLVSVE